VQPGASVRPLSRRASPRDAQWPKISSEFFDWRLTEAGRKPSEITTKFKEAERNRIAVVMIRLARVGAPKQPYYRIVVIEKDRARNGRSIEVVGTYNPRTSPATVDLKHERIAYWRSKGATLSRIMEKLVTKNPAPASTAPAETATDPATA
jgi:small subunit ribosomal protein S16